MTKLESREEQIKTSHTVEYLQTTLDEEFVSIYIKNSQNLVRNQRTPF